MFGLLFLVMFIVPAAVLGWRLVVTKTRSTWIRIGAAAAAMTTLVGASVVFDDIDSFRFEDWREDLALLAALSGSFYLFAWSMRRRGNRRHNTLSIIGGVIGLVPALGALASVIFRVT